MDRKQAIEMAKKNVVSIVCGVVALAAIIFYFVAAKPKFSALEADMKKRVGKPDEMRQRVNAEYSLPPVNNDGPGQKLPKGFLPNPKALEQVDNIVQQLQAQANRVIELALRLNRANREFLIAGALPKPSDQIPAYDFRAQYSQVLKRGGIPDATKTKVVNLPDKILQSAEPPTLEEINKAKQEKWSNEYATQIILTGGQPANLKEVYADFLKATENFDEEFRKKRAEQYKVYLEPGALTISSVADTTQQAPSPQAMWFAQMALWVQQDVCMSIATLNNSRPEFTNIRSTPVKHLLSIDIKPDISMYAMKGGQINTMPGAAPADPAAGGAPADATGGIGPKDFVVAPTGRVCNPMYDVVHFGINVVIDARYVKAFLQQLQYGRFMTVLEVDVQGVDLDEALDEGYEYGKQPVVEVKIKVEALFLRNWTAWIMPPKSADGTQPPPVQGPMPLDVQRMLGIQPPNQENRPADAAPTATAS